VASDYPDFREGGPPPSRETLIKQEAFRLLMSSEGQTLLAELSAKPIAEADELRVLTKLRSQHPAELVNAVFAQTKLRARARAKFSRAHSMYFTSDGLEQASTERMAMHHATLFDGFEAVADFCSGIGGDLIGLAQSRKVLAVDMDPVHSHMGVLNAGAYGVAKHVEPLVADVELVGLSSANGVNAERFGVFIDPARRMEGRRLTGGESSPSLEWCFSLAESGAAVAVKAGPAIPLDRIPAEWGIEFVSEGRELKEALLTSPRMDRGARRATVLVPERQTLLPMDGDDIPVQEPGQFLLDPDPAVTRAGLVEDLARTLGGAWKIDERVAFLSSNGPMETPFGRSLAVEASLPWNLNRLKEALRSLDVGSVDIRKRGSAVDVDDIQRRLKLTGSREAVVVLTRVADRPWAFVCHPEERSDEGSSLGQ
jgi:hypothetical protein